LHVLFASSLLDPIVWALTSLVALLNRVVPNPGLSLILLAALIRLVFWPLNTAQFKAMLGMQKIAPRIKKLQEKYKGDQSKLQQETMALYKESGVNPLAGCWPMLVQLPILFSVYWVVVSHKEMFDAPFLWIGSAISAHFPHFLASSLAQPDLFLVIIYMISQYVSMRFTSMPATDPAQAQQLKIMQVVSPLMIGYFGYRANWPAAMVLYWLSYNVFTMAQQFYMLRRYHEPLSFIDSEHAITADVKDGNGGTPQKSLAPSGNGVSKAKTKKKNTKGA